MYKKIGIIALLGLVTVIGVAYAYPEAGNAGSQSRNFVDADGDGVCDYYQSGQCPGYKNGYGKGNGYRNNNGNGFVDEDGDGICDHYQSGQCHGYGFGTGFVDEDGDGICDNCQNACGGYGNKHGMGQNRP